MERTNAFRTTLATLLTTSVVMAAVATSQKSAATNLFDLDISRSANAGRIFGGANVTENEFPTQVYISSSLGRFIIFCGGTIISKTWILTAAHCVNNTKHTWVGFGSSYLRLLKHILAKRVISHENYTLYGRYDNNAVNDIGLVELSKPIDLNGYTAAAAQLPWSRHHLTKNGVVVGWGRWTYKSVRTQSASVEFVLTLHVRNPDIEKQLVPSSNEAHVLQKLDVNVTSCPYYNAHVICVESEHGEGECSGDSGGPLLIDGEVHGVASYVDNSDEDPNLNPNENCAENNTWTAYTPVADFREWIRIHSGV